MSEVNQKIFPVKTDGQRLDVFLASVLSVARHQVQLLIRQGQVLVNGQTPKKTGVKLCIGDQVELELSDKQKVAPQSLQPIPVLYEDEDVLVVDKPAGLVVHPGAGHKGLSLAEQLLSQYPNLEGVGDPKRPGIVHRLDKDTSGCLVVAKTKESFAGLRDLFLSRQVEKHYLTLVFGQVLEPFTLSKPMGKSSKDFRKMVLSGFLTAKFALTEAVPLERLQVPSRNINSKRVDEMTLLLVKLHTGRTHQIRVHLAGEGLPVAGDELYGGEQVRIKGLDRHFLHAYSIAFTLHHGRTVHVVSPLPGDLRIILKNLDSKVVERY